MPDELTLMDLYKKLLEIEVKLDALNPVAKGDIMKNDDSPFWNPDKKCFDINYYRQQQDEGKKG